MKNFLLCVSFVCILALSGIVSAKPYVITDADITDTFSQLVSGLSPLKKAQAGNVLALVHIGDLPTVGTMDNPGDLIVFARLNDGVKVVVKVDVSKIKKNGNQKKLAHGKFVFAKKDNQFSESEIYGASLTLANAGLPAGDYIAVIKVANPTTGKVSKLSTKFTIVDSGESRHIIQPPPAFGEGEG